MRKIFNILVGLLGLIFAVLVKLYLRQDMNRFGGFLKKPWLEHFIILFIVMSLKYESDIFDQDRFSRGELDFRQQQSIIVYLKAYLHKIGKEIEWGDYEKVVIAMPLVWRTHTAPLVTRALLKRFYKDGSPEGTDADCEALVSEVMQLDKTSEGWQGFYNLLLLFSFESRFTLIHSEEWASYTETMLQDYVRDIE